jgi:hypothetical protein
MKAIASLVVLASVILASQMLRPAIADEAGPARPGAIAPPGPVSVLVSTDKTRYQVGDEVRFTRTITNRGKDDMSIYPFAYLNGHVRFYWINTEAFAAHKYGEGKCGVTRPKTISPGKSLVESLSDNVVTREPGIYLLYVSSELPGAGRLGSNVLRIEVVAAGKDRP